MERYESYKDSGLKWIGDIPSHWNTVRLKHKGEVIIGLSYKPDNQVEEQEGVLVMRSSNVQEGKPSFQDNVYVDCEIPEKLRTRDGDILICSRNGSRRLIGKNCFLNKELENLTWGVFMTVYRSESPKFFYWLLNSPIFESQSGMFLTSTINQLTVSTLENMIVPFVEDENEQHQIVSFLDTKTSLIDSLIEKTQRKIELLKEQRTSLINEFVTKGLNPNVEMKDSGVEWIGEIPSHWSKIKLNYISERIGDGLHSTPSYVDLSEFYFINGNNLIDGEIKFFESTKRVSEEEFRKHYIELNENTLLLSINGTIGNLSLYNGEKVILGKSSCYINLLDGNNREFIYYVLLSDSIKRYFTFELTGTTIFNLSLNSVRNTPVPFPPLKEQNQIVEYLDNETQLIDKTISNEEKRIELLKEYRQSLISEVVTGKLKVSEV